MAVFESRYKELGFYVNNSFKTFKNGRYVTENAVEIKALEKLADVKRIDEPKAKEEPKAEETDAKPKKAPTRKSSAK